MANTKVVNETGGPMRPRRVRVPIGVAYGVDLEQVKTVLVEAMTDLPEVLESAPGAAPSVVVKAFGASSIDLDVIVWLAEARDMTTFMDSVNSAIYNSLKAANIEIPYPKRDVYLYPSDDDGSVADTSGSPATAAG
jgi:small-conductance mechanosensitive channel